jgi:hypothetical protein
VLEVLLEPVQVVGLGRQVELGAHHAAEDVHFLWEGEPLHSWERVEHAREEAHNLQVAIDDFLDVGVEHLDGYRC